MDEVLVARDLQRSYGDTTALGGVSLTVGAGEVVALVGPNGAGKTTFVRGVTGTTDVEGEVTLFGEPPAAVRRSRIGLLPQEFAPQDRLTARELVAYYAGLYDETRPVSDVLADVGLASTADTWYERLSGGQRRRTCLATALVNDPDLLVLDEPTTGIDPAGRRSVHELLLDAADRGTTVLVTTHDMAEAERLADRVALLADGQLVAVDEPDALIEAYGGDSRLVLTGIANPSAAATELSYPAEPGSDDLTLHGVDQTEIGEVVTTLADAGVDYEELTWREPDLEDVYLELTGSPAGALRARNEGSGVATQTGDREDAGDETDDRGEGDETGRADAGEAPERDAAAATPGEDRGGEDA